MFYLIDNLSIPNYCFLVSSSQLSKSYYKNINKNGNNNRSPIINFINFSINNGYSNKNQQKNTVDYCCFYNIAAEQKAKQTYEYLLNMADDPDVIEPLRFLREREVVHFQRFGEALEIVKGLRNEKKIFY